ncbi:glycoside hydrolase family 18 protein [Danxiaibacter flavus]|uniref:Glycoside hydrolase family 18 protein n=1 Tax=Danxiaibacter flavus TaxID=3049108 RepID=A0ABV3ZBF5_9BACT|nr:glycoside hydrolase family 18 protein [Chitinophagaceae bacterium DXS]
MKPQLKLHAKKCLLLFLLLTLNNIFHVASAGYYKAFEDFQDSTAKAAETAAQKSAQDAAKKAQGAEKEVKGFFQNIGAAFQFRKNSRAKEQQRVIGIVNGMGITDSIAAVNNNLKVLVSQLSTTEKHHFDTLLSLILRSADSLNKIAGKKNQPGPTGTPVPSIKPDTTSPAELIAANIEALTDKLTLMLAAKNNNLTEDTQKAKQLLALRKIAAGNDTITTTTDGKLFKRSKLSIYKRADVYGFYNSFYNFTPQTLPFNLLNGVIYDALILEGSTGNIRTADVKQTYQVTQYTKEAGCELYYTIFGDRSTSVFLRSPQKVQGVIESILHMLKTNNINGLNINFRYLQYSDQYLFTDFLSMLSKSVKLFRPAFKLFVTVPPTDPTNIYNVKALDSIADKFVVDFAVNYATTQAPLAALDGKENTNLTTSISFYLNQKIPSSKLIINIPYKGVQWAMFNNTNKDSLIQYVSYSDVRTKYGWPVTYDDATNSAYMDTLYEKANITRRIWFDDEYTLPKKYDYILASGVSGIGIDYLGYDKKYGELTDLLAYKVLAIDTTALPDSTWGPRPLTYTEKIIRKLFLYRYILSNPCEVCFENAANDAQKWDSIPVYLRDLKIDSIVDAQNSMIALNNLSLPEGKKVPLLTSFSYINNELNRLLLVLTIVFLVLSIGAAVFYVYKIRTETESWRYKKVMGVALTALVLLFSFSVITCIFTNDYIPYFGVSAAQTQKIAVYAKADSTALASLSSPLTQTVSAGKNCQPDEDCINIPLQTLILVLVFGSLVGLVCARYFIAPLLKREDVP